MSLPSSISDEALIHRIKAGEEKAFRALFDRYYKYLVVTAYKIYGDSEKARDLAQDVFFELWKKRAQITIQSAPKAYLRKAVVNKTLNFIKAQRLDFSEPEIFQQNKLSYSADAQANLEADDLQQSINAAIASLPERCRMVFSLCRLEGLSHKEIAEALNISTKTVENQMTKAMKVLRNAVQPHISRKLSWMIFFLKIYLLT